VGEPPIAESSRYLVTARPLNNVKAAFSMWSDPRLYSQGSSEGSQSTELESQSGIGTGMPAPRCSNPSARLAIQSAVRRVSLWP
jgi:hypothetical protein